MKKVLFTATIGKHIDGFHKPFLKSFKEKKWVTYVITGDDYKIEEYCDFQKKVDICRSPLKFRNIKAIFQLKRIIEEEKFDIIHCHTPMGSIVTRLASITARRKYGTRVIYTAHGFHFYKGAKILNWLVYYPIEKLMSHFTDTIITINEEDYNFALKKFSRNCKDIQYVKGIGVDKSKYDFKLSKDEKKNILGNLNLDSDDFIMIFPARLDKNKNQKFLIEVMKKLVPMHKNIHLLLPGRDELNGYYQNIVKEYNLTENIHFLGYRDDIAKLQKISNISLSSSLREGLPVNILEAVSSNLPTVALKCRGMSDLIEDGVNGFLIDIDSKSKVDDFCKCVLEYYNGKKFVNSSKTNGIYLDKILERMNGIYFK